MVTIKTPQEIALMREGGKLLASAVKKIASEVRPGVAIADLDKMAREIMEQGGGKPAFLGYRQSGTPPFPSTVCISVNSEVIHGIGNRDIILKEGDIVGLDTGVQYQAKGGLFTDMAVTVPVGVVSDEATRLMNTTRESLELAIEAIKPGVYIHELGKIVQNYCEERGYGVIRDFTGHGIGYKAHEEPAVFNYYDSRMPKIQLRPGMVICVEPMITLGDWHVIIDRDGWTVRTQDKSLAAHFEHTIAVTESGHEVLTRFED